MAVETLPFGEVDAFLSANNKLLLQHTDKSLLKFIFHEQLPLLYPLSSIAYLDWNCLLSYSKHTATFVSSLSAFFNRLAQAADTLQILVIEPIEMFIPNLSLSSQSFSMDEEDFFAFVYHLARFQRLTPHIKVFGSCGASSLQLINFSAASVLFESVFKVESLKPVDFSGVFGTFWVKKDTVGSLVLDEMFMQERAESCSIEELRYIFLHYVSQHPACTTSFNPEVFAQSISKVCHQKKKIGQASDLFAESGQLTSSLVDPSALSDILVFWRVFFGTCALKSTNQPATNHSLLHRRNFPRGLLLWGKPGTGKSSIPKFLMSQNNEGPVNFHFYTIPDILHAEVGASEKAVADIFAKAKAHQPCVVFIDEVEALFPRACAETNAVIPKIKSQFCGEMDALRAGSCRVLVMAATNLPHSIDPKMLTFDRFGWQVEVRFLPAETLLEHLTSCMAQRSIALDDLESYRRLLLEALQDKPVVFVEEAVRLAHERWLKGPSRPLISYLVDAVCSEK